MILKYFAKHKNNKGFTLVEVLVVASIILILGFVAIPNLLRSRVEANHSVAKSTLVSISKAMESYSAFMGNYPSLTSDLVTISPPYLNVDYFTGEHSGYVYTVNTLTSQSYSFTATPTSSNKGILIYTVVTGGAVSEI